MTRARPKLVHPAPILKAALYARFSTDIQNDRSVERQFADLERVAERLSLKLNKQHYFSDHAESGSSLFDRPGLTRNLIEAAEAGQFDVVLVEHTDRLSRRRADLFWLADQLKFCEVKIYTPAGEVSDLQLTFDGHQNENFIAVLAARVKSGHDLLARDGLIPHGAAFGYDCVPGQPGVKAINLQEAAIIVRIFTEYASGKSPRKIALDLTNEGIAPPGGEGSWNFQYVCRLLRNELYIGIYVKNRSRNVRNPKNGKIVGRPGDPDLIIRTDVPHLRIMSQELWDAAQKIRAERADKIVTKGHVERATVPRTQHLLDRLLRCAQCGGRMIITCSDRHGKKGMTCSAAWNRQNCAHRKTYNLERLTNLTISKMHEHLTDPEFVKQRASARVKELARLQREGNSERETAQRDKDRVDLKIRKLVLLAEDDESDDMNEVRERLKELRIMQRGLAQRLAMLAAETNVIPLPGDIEALGRNIDLLHERLRDNPADPECRIALGNLLESVVVHPTDYNKPYDVSVYARHAAYVGDMPLFPEKTSTESEDCSYRYRQTRGNTVDFIKTPVLLGRWREAA